MVDESRHYIIWHCKKCDRVVDCGLTVEDLKKEENIEDAKYISMCCGRSEKHFCSNKSVFTDSDLLYYREHDEYNEFHDPIECDRYVLNWDDYYNLTYSLYGGL